MAEWVKPHGNAGTAPELKKARIEVLGENGAAEEIIVCLFNPSEYSIRSGASYSQEKGIGKDKADSQYIQGDSVVLSLTLYFDTTDGKSTEENKGQTSVTVYMEKLEKLLKIDGKQHRPPKIRFVWGSLQFQGFLLSLSQKYTLFSVEGKPLRVKADLEIREAPENRSSRFSPPESPDRTKYRTVIQGMSLWRLAYEEYGDPEKWTVIAEANNLASPLAIEPGEELIVPALDRKMR